MQKHSPVVMLKPRNEKYLIYFVLFGNVVFGKDYIMEKNKQKYLVRMKGNNSKSMKVNNSLSMPETGMDYADEQEWLDRCSLKGGSGK